MLDEAGADPGSTVLGTDISEPALSGPDAELPRRSRCAGCRTTPRSLLHAGRLARPAGAGAARARQLPAPQPDGDAVPRGRRRGLRRHLLPQRPHLLHPGGLRSGGEHAGRAARDGGHPGAVRRRAAAARPAQPAHHPRRARVLLCPHAGSDGGTAPAQAWRALLAALQRPAGGDVRRHRGYGHARASARGEHRAARVLGAWRGLAPGAGQPGLGSGLRGTAGLGALPHCAFPAPSAGLGALSLRGALGAAAGVWALPQCAAPGATAGVRALSQCAAPAAAAGLGAVSLGVPRCFVRNGRAAAARVRPFPHRGLYPGSRARL